MICRYFSPKYFLMKNHALNSELELIVEVAKSWNNLDVSYIHSILIPDFRYASQWVFEEMCGKEKYLEYLSSKFLKIKEGIEKRGDKLTAEIGYCTIWKIGKPCIVLTQYSEGVARPATLLIESENGLITRIDLCGIPEPETAKLTGNIPT